MLGARHAKLRGTLASALAMVGDSRFATKRVRECNANPSGVARALSLIGDSRDDIKKPENVMPSYDGRASSNSSNFGAHLI